MLAAAIPKSEQARLAALYRYQILDTAPERAFDSIVQIASRLAGTPIALISFVDTDRQWFKARLGLDEQEMDRCIAFCGHTILDDEVLEVCDALLDPRFKENPLVIGPPGLRYYAGAPIVTREGLKLGSLCIIDTVPRTPLSKDDRRALKNLAALVVDQLEQRVTLKERADHFAALTHEIRSPLNAALGYVEVIHSRMFGEIQPARYGEYIDHINEAGNQILDVISEFLDFFKHEAGFLTLRETRFDFGLLQTECTGLVEAMIASSGLSLDPAAVVENLKISGDRQRVRQIMMNLLINAAKFTPPGGRISVDSGIGSRGEFWFSVSDTGVGMDPDEIATALTPFGQVSEKANQHIAGSGLGLPLAQRLAELHGGSLGIESEIGRGTSITVRLPAERVTAADLEEPVILTGLRRNA